MFFYNFSDDEETINLKELKLKLKTKRNFKSAANKPVASTSFASQNVQHVTAEGDTDLDNQIANNSTEQTRKSRKRKRDPSKWKKNVRKDKRNRGEAYISSRKKTSSCEKGKKPEGLY